MLYDVSMRTINRRELNQHSGRILDSVVATGEPVEVVSRDGGAVVISPRARSRYEEWMARGLVQPARSRLTEAPRVTSERTVDQMLADIDSDH